MRPRRAVTATAVFVAVMAAASVVALGMPQRTPAPLTDEVQDALEQLAQPSSPLPREGDERIGPDTYRTAEPCTVVQQHYGGTLTVFETGWTSVFDGPYGQVGVIGADDGGGCRYLVANGPTLTIDAELEVPELAGLEAFGVVSCATAPLVGASVDFADDRGTQRAVIIGGFGDVDGEPAPLDTPIEASLVSFSGSSARTDEPPDVTGIDTGSLRTVLDPVQAYVYESPNGAVVTARCTPAVRIATPTG